MTIRIQTRKQKPLSSGTSSRKNSSGNPSQKNKTTDASPCPGKKFDLQGAVNLTEERLVKTLVEDHGTKVDTLAFPPINHAFASGATSSEHVPDIAQIPTSFLARTGRRFSLGTTKHGRGNYLRAFKYVYGEIRLDIDFARDRYNHAVLHLKDLSKGTDTDDQIGAVSWFLCFADLVEQKGFSWQAILKSRTPEEEEEYHRTYGVKYLKEEGF